METGTKPSSTFDQKLTDSKAFIKMVDVADLSSFGRQLAKIIFGVNKNCLLVEFVLGQNSVGNPGSDAYSSLEKMFVNVVSDRFPDDTEFVCVELWRLQIKLVEISENNCFCILSIKIGFFDYS